MQTIGILGKEILMKFFRNLFDSIGDIFLALIVLAVAIWVIVWRIDIVTGNNSDEGLLQHATVQEQEDQGYDDSASIDLPEDNEDTSSEGEGQDVDGTDGAEGEQSDDVSTELWVDEMLTREVEVTIPSGAASEATAPLVDAGLFESYAEYELFCTQVGKDPLLIRASTYTFPIGSTKADVINYLID